MSQFYGTIYFRGKCTSLLSSENSHQVGAIPADSESFRQEKTYIFDVGSPCVMKKSVRGGENFEDCKHHHDGCWLEDAVPFKC